jgi:uncharacterized protein Yka (UPF0111/DUF47 family)
LRFRSRQSDERLLDLIEEAAANAKRTTALLREMLEDYPERRHLAREILKCEQDGDRVAHDIIHRLNENGVRSPWPSGDVYQLTSALDDIVDYAEEAADHMGLYGIEAPMAQAEELAQLLEQSGAAVADAVAALRGRSELAPHLVRVHQLENEGDRVSREAIASLFAKGIDPMVVIRWKDIFESLEQGIDACETVAHVVEGLSLKNGHRRP